MAANLQHVPIQAYQGQAGAVYPSSLFGLPGVTNWSEQRENLDGTTATLSAGNQIDFQFAGNFKQTDVVFGWTMEVSVAQTYTAGGATFTNSPHFPYNIIGPWGLNFQNQFDSMNFPDGFHAALMQMVRPVKFGVLGQVMDQSLIAVDTYSQQPNLVSASNYTSASTTVKFTLNLTPCVLISTYYDLESDGLLYADKATPIKAWVSPQLMSGTNRVISPRVRANSMLSQTAADTSPITSASGTPTFAGTATLGFQRRIIYQPQNSNDSPPIFNWQYVRDYRRFSLSGVSSIDIAVPQVGQIMALIYSFWDPASGAVGSPIPVANIKEIDLIYGSGLYKFQDTPLRAQQRFYRQHQILPPEGVIIHDMAIQDDGTLSNANALNTLTTSGCTLHIDFTATQSNTAYMYMVFEALRYVAIQ
jgi:hypothetical protein